MDSLAVHDNIRDRICGNTPDQTIDHGPHAESLIGELRKLYDGFEVGKPIDLTTRSIYLTHLEYLGRAIRLKWNIEPSEISAEGGYCDVGEEHLNHIEQGGY